METKMELAYSLSHPSILSQLRVLSAIARKDWIQHWRYPLNAVSSILQPIIWLTPVYFMGQVFSVNGQAQGFAAYAGTADYMSFILLGSVLSQFINAVFWGMGYSLKNDMDAGVLETNWLAPIPRLLLLVGRTITSMLITASTALALLGVAALLFGFHPTGKLLPAVLSLLPMLVGLYGFGFAFAALVLLMKEANTLVDISNFLVSTLSGANFPVNALPRWLLPLALAIPLTYGFDSVRGYLLETRTLLPLQVELYIMLVFMGLMLVLGTYVFQRLERHVRQRGSLGQH